MRLLVGSQALKLSSEKYLSNAKHFFDYDWIATYEGFEELKNSLRNIRTIIPQNKGKSLVIKTTDSIHEIELAWDNTNAAELLDIAKCDTSVAFEHNGHLVATPDLVFALKKSHRYLKNSPHFLKTMVDFNHLKSMGCDVPQSLEAWYKRREKDTYNYNHPKLNVTKKDFFKDDQVPYTYDHDSIHRAVAHLDRPAYEYYKEDTAEVECSKALFYQLPEEVRLYGVLEESYVLALERSQIPAPGVITPRQSFEIALMKVCTSITSGWFRAFAYENYFKVRELYSDSYMDKFRAGLENGTVKPFTGSLY